MGVRLSPALREAVPAAADEVLQELARLGRPAARRSAPLSPDIWWEEWRGPQGRPEPSPMSPVSRMGSSDPREAGRAGAGARRPRSPCTASWSVCSSTFATEWGARFGGFPSPLPLFFPRQAGAFHFVVAAIYLVEYFRYRGVCLLVMTKSIAVVFLFLAALPGRGALGRAALRRRRRVSWRSRWSCCVGPAGCRCLGPAAGRGSVSVVRPTARPGSPRVGLPGVALGCAAREPPDRRLRVPLARLDASGRVEIEYAGEPAELVRTAAGLVARAASSAPTSAAACSGRRPRSATTAPATRASSTAKADPSPGRPRVPSGSFPSRSRVGISSSASDEPALPGRDRRVRLRRAPPPRGPQGGLPHRRPRPPIPGPLRRAGASQHHVAPGRHRRPGGASSRSSTGSGTTAGPTS